MYYKFYGRYFGGPPKKFADTNYIRKYPEYIVLSTALGVPVISYSVSSPSGTNTTEYRASLSPVVGLRVGYKYLSLGFNVKLPGQQPGYTNTSYASLSFRIQSNRFNQSFLVSVLKGVTDVNSSDGSTATYIKRDDIQAVNLSYGFVWNLAWKKYTYVGPRTYSQRQMKSKGGFLVKTGIWLQAIHGDSAILNPSEQPYYTTFRNVTGISALSMPVAPGMGGNLVFLKKFYLSSVFFLGPNFSYYAYQRSKDEDYIRDFSVQFLGSLDIGFGYQTERFFAGLHYDYQYLSARITDAVIQFNSGYLGLTVGCRIGTPKVMRDIYNRIFPY